MNTYKKLLMVSRSKLRVNSYLCLTFSGFAIIAMSLCLASPGACAYVEDYYGGNFSYQTHFNDDGYVSFRLAYMDSVYFAGVNDLLFTLHSDHSSTYTSKLYWTNLACATSETCYGSVDIGNTTELNFRFKTVAFNDVLYVFYTPAAAASGYSLNRIYYRTATTDFGSDGEGRGLIFADEKSFPGVATTLPNVISFATVMNGRMYIIFTSGADWYYISSQDGLTFGPAMLFYSSSAAEAILGPAGTVFHVPDPVEGWKERMMISYCPPWREDPIIKYFFFDGQTAYGGNSIETYYGSTPLFASSVRLFTGTVRGYSNDRYAIQVFIGVPNVPSGNWSNIYHAQYIPSDQDGDKGTWSAWNLLNNSGDDRFFDLVQYSTDSDWAIAPGFVDPYGTGDTTMMLHITYSIGTEYTSKVGGGYDTIWFRESDFHSDLMKHDPDQDRTAQAGSQDLSSSMVVGVIEGTPPFPINGGVPVALNSNTSIVDLTQQQTYTTTTTWSVGGSVALSLGVKAPGEGAFLGKLSAGLKYTQESSQSHSITTQWSLYSFTDNSPTPKDNPGDLGWLMVLKPEILSSQYIVTAFDGNSLVYCNDSACSDKTTEEMRLILLTWGQGSFIEFLPYYLQDPSADIGDDPINGARTLLEGMAKRPLSTDLAAWQQIDHFDPSYDLSTDLPTIAGTLNVQLKETFAEMVNDAQTSSINAGFSASAKKLGLINFGEELNVNFSMDIKTATMMSYSLGFWLNLPGCTTTGCCISELDIDAAIYVPNDDVSGYNAPWISNDIRNFQRPKPWCLSYGILNPINPCPSGVGSIPSRLTVRQLRGTLFLDPNYQNRDRVSMKFSLEGIAPDFSLDDPEAVYVRLGNYAVNSDRSYVVSRYFQGKDLVLKLKETEDSESAILVKLSYHSDRPILDIDFNADHINLIHLSQSYGLGTAEEDKTVPLRFFLGDRYVADAEVNARSTINDQDVVCVLAVDNSEENTMPMPASATAIQCSSVAMPILQSDPNQAIPIGLGEIATGGNNVSIGIGMAGFNGPVDLYFGIFAPDIDPLNMCILKSDLSFQPHTDGIIPWKTNVTGSTSKSLFGEIPAYTLPLSKYYIFLAATQAGKDFSSGYYLWSTQFEIGTEDQPWWWALIGELEAANIESVCDLFSSRSMQWPR